MYWQETKDFLSPCFPEDISAEMELLMPGELREIRVRTHRPTILVTSDRVTSLSWRPEREQVEALAEALSEHSLYAREEETASGYITLRGGHRMGLCGRIHTHQGKQQLLETGSLCIRIACEWPGAADELLPLVAENEHVLSTLVIGLPGCGKTTLLRDLARLLGNQCRQVAIIDERGELAACIGGVPQLDVGESTDVLDNCAKTMAIPWLIRSMTPQIIITDELANADDAASVLDAMACGAAVMASVHGSGLHEAASRPALAGLMARRAFQRYVVLSPEGGGRIAAVYDRSGAPL